MSDKKDVIVIGAGMAGLLIAYYLQEAGKDVLVLEADKIASGQTDRTTAKITCQHGIKYSTLLKKVGRNQAEIYARANEGAINEYEKLIKRLGIKCDFERVPAYLYSTTSREQLLEEAEAAASLGIDVFYTEQTELPFPVVGAVGYRNQARFSPPQFLKALAGKLEIREDTPVTRVSGRTVYTREGVYTADKIVLATHYPFLNMPGFYFLRQHQERSYVLALKGCRPIRGMYYGVDEGGLSLRQAGEYLLLGGAGHRTGKKRCGGAYERLRKAAGQHFPEGREVACWSAQDCMPHDGIPFIGRFSVFTPHLYVATGFQKWGMSTAMVAAMILREEVQGRFHPWSRVFRPQRMLVKAGIGKFLVDVGESIKGLTIGWLGKRCKRCTHLGCRLKWNPNENSWDCPCHGSRFSQEGRIYDNPAQTDLNKG
ncbi:MAG: FAD-dependent oxidoreductase [Lachnospiraceae bacterium]|nr:FAD-dependent oxidoreductase [Lachnospiraceae bacterium]